MEVILLAMRRYQYGSLIPHKDESREVYLQRCKKFFESHLEVLTFSIARTETLLSEIQSELSEVSLHQRVN